MSADFRAEDLLVLQSESALLDDEVSNIEELHSKKDIEYQAGLLNFIRRDYLTLKIPTEAQRARTLNAQLQHGKFKYKHFY